MTKQEFTVQTLNDRIAALVGERQRLRASKASPNQLEANRREIATRQHELSQALIALHLPPPQPGFA